MDGATPAQAASREAFEEAGAEGKITGNCLGLYSYKKAMEDKIQLQCLVAIFPLKVKRLHAIYPEMDERRRRWFNLKKAASLLEEPELSQIVKSFDPKRGTK